MKIISSELAGLLLITPPRRFGDERGFLLESYRESEWDEAGLPRFVQDNHSRSAHGVLRGLHLSVSSAGQGKLVRCASGRIWDVAVDLRRGSPSFGRWEGHELDDREHRQLYIPPGFAHGFCVLSERADVCYKLTSSYDPETERGIAWDDPTLAVAWPITSPTLSGRDRANPTLQEFLRREA